MRYGMVETMHGPAPLADVADQVVDDACSHYRSTLRRVAERIEDQALFLDVLQGGCVSSATSTWARPMASGVKRRMSDLAETMNVRLPEMMRPVHLSVLEAALGHGALEATDYALSELLRHAPEVESVRPLFEEAVRRGTIRREDAESRLALYRFESLGRIDFGNGCIPMDVHFRQHGAMLYVVDMKNACVRRVSPQGQELGALFLGLRMPQGIFGAEGAGVWVCDTDNGRLLLLDENDAVAAEVDFRRFVREAGEGAGPRYGCACGGRLYVILANEQTRERFLVSLRPDNPAGTLQRHDRHGGVNPLRVYRFGNDVFLYDWPGVEAARLQAGTGRQSPLPRAFRGTQVRGMVPEAGHAFILSGGKIGKVSGSGSPVFSYDLAGVAGVTGVAPLSMTSGSHGGQRCLAVSDGVSASVYLFAV